METLAKQIEERMHGVWKHCLIYEKDLERIWPINEKDQKEKIVQFATKYGFHLRFYGKGMGAIFDQISFMIFSAHTATLPRARVPSLLLSTALSTGEAFCNSHGFKLQCKPTETH